MAKQIPAGRQAKSQILISLEFWELGLNWPLVIGVWDLTTIDAG